MAVSSAMPMKSYSSSRDQGRGSDAFASGWSRWQIRPTRSRNNGMNSRSGCELHRLHSPKSASPLSTCACTPRPLSSCRRKRISGFDLPNSCIALGNRRIAIDGSRAILTWFSCCRARARICITDCSKSSRYFSTVGRNSRPQGVGVTERVVRVNSCTPTMSSNWRIVRVSAGCEIASSSAARENEPCRVTQTNALKCLNDKFRAIRLLLFML